MLGEEISTEGPIPYIYCSEQLNHFDSHGKVPLEVTIEQSLEACYSNSKLLLKYTS